MQGGKTEGDAAAAAASAFAEAPPAPGGLQAASGGGGGGSSQAATAEGASGALDSSAGVGVGGMQSFGDGHFVYVSYEEKKELSEKKPGRKTSGHTYIVKFFLVDTHGTEYLAATGEDQGDAHYLYENQTSFPFLRANNKADVRTWLEGIIDRSKERAGVQSHLVDDSVPADPTQIRLPKFVGHSHDKHELADGRHRIEWFLLDEKNDAHLAIVGEEKETRDGHYLYRTHGIFDKAYPLQVGNQREVERWIDIMVYHAGVAPLGASGKAVGGSDSQGGGPSASGRTHSALLSDTSAHRGAGSSRAAQSARPSGQKKAGLKHDLLKQATFNVKKFKAQGGRLGVDPDQEAREVVAAELQRWAQEEAQRREAAKKQALAYVTDPLVGKEAGAVKRCLAALQQAVQDPGFLPPPSGTSGSHQQQLNLVDTLAALRELAHMYAPLSLVAMPELKDVLGKLQGHQHPEVQLLATCVLEQWLRTAVAQAQVLSDPRYVQDPRSVLDTRLASREVMDPIVGAVTRRKMHPPPPQQLQLQAQHERAGSRLGPGVAAALLAGGGGGGGGQDSQAAGAATPGGLSTRPSEQSLQDLVGSGGPQWQPAGGGLSGPPGASEAAARLAAGQTVERRRLNLNALDSPAGAGMLMRAAPRRQAQQTVSSSDGGDDGGDDSGGEGTGADEAGNALPGSSLLLGGGRSQQPGAAAGGDVGSRGLVYSASVDLINAPVEEMESEQAEFL